MNIKEILAYPFENWLRPVYFVTLTFPVFLISIATGIGIVQLIAMVLFFPSLLLLFISLIILLLKKQWGKAFYILLFIFSMIIVIGLLA